MRKTVISVAALAMSTALAGLAFAAAPDGSTPTDSISVVTPAATSAGADVADAPDDSDGRVGGGHGADDAMPSPSSVPAPVPSPRTQQPRAGDDGPGHDVGDDHGAGGHGADDGPGHDVGDDHGAGGPGADDCPGHDVGDDHGSGGSGSDG
jgi:hypothetical protein